MSMSLSIHCAPSAEAVIYDGRAWVEITCGNFGGRATLHLHGPKAEEHAKKIAEAINAAHRDEAGEQ